MKITKKIRVFVIIIITAFLFQVAGVPTSSYAKWNDSSGDLPGMVDDSTISSLTYVAVGLAVIGLVYWIVRANKNKQAGDGTDKLEKPSEKKPESGGDSSFLKDNEDKTRVTDFSTDF